MNGINKKMIQVRFFGEDNSKNSSGFTMSSFCNYAYLSQFAPIYHLGIQALPGTKFYLNQSLEPIYIGATGIYEIDTDGTTATINGIRFARDSMEAINNNQNGYLIIDIVYGQGTGVSAE